jgi:putative transposase
MGTTYPVDWPQFYTASIYRWQHLLSDSKRKEIITGSLKFMVDEHRIILYAFVIMAYV